MQLLLEFTLCVLAVYRVSYLATQEEGPFGIFSFIQSKTVKQSNWFERGMNCVLCLSFWLSAIGGLYLAQSVVQFVLYWLAIAGGVLVLHKWLNKQR
jgi:hypothetical protein